MTYTSAQANKLLKKLHDEHAALLDRENRSKEFRAAMGEDVESVRPGAEVYVMVVRPFSFINSHSDYTRVYGTSPAKDDRTFIIPPSPPKISLPRRSPPRSPDRTRGVRYK